MAESVFRNRVTSFLDQLPPQQQLVGEYMLDNLTEIPFASVPELAARINVSEATVVRFAQRIGFKGFADLKAELKKLAKAKITPPSGLGMVFHAPLQSDTLSAAALQEVENIRATLESVDKSMFQKAADALFNADHVFSYGMGVSAHLSGLFTYMLVQVGLRASLLSSNFTSPLEQMIPIRDSDLLVVFSLLPYSKSTIDMLDYSSQHGIPSLAISDRLSSPAARSATHALSVQTHNLLMTNALAAICVLLNGLITEVAVRHGDATTAIERINHVLHDSPGVLRQ